MSIQYGSSGDVRLEAGSPSEAEVPLAVLDNSRWKATDLVNSYLESVYPDQIPIEASGDVPRIVNSLTNSLAVYYVLRTIHRGPSPLAREVTEEFYDKPLETLNLIVAGKLVITELGSVSEASSVMGSRDDKTPIFDVDDVESSQVDPDLLDDIADDRS